MRNSTLLYRLAALFSGTAVLISCSEKTPEETKDVRFPDKRTLVMTVGETCQLEFSAEADWSLSADKSFVRFIENEVEKPSVSGKAGEASVTVLMKDNGQGFEEQDKAQITMKMEGKSAVIYEIERPVKEREITVMVKESFTSQPVAAEKLYIEYKSRTACQIGVEANFDWYVKSYPEWMGKLELGPGKAGVPYEMKKITLPREQYAYSHMENSDENRIVISSADDKFTLPFPVTYSGMPDNQLSTLPPTITSSGISFNHEGFVMGNDMTGGGPTEEKTASFTVETLNYDYETVLVEYKDGKAQEVSRELAWLDIVEDGVSHKFTVSVKEEFTGGEEETDRNLYLYVLPPAFKEGYDFSQDFGAAGKFLNKNKVAVACTLLGNKKVDGFYVDKYYAGSPTEILKEFSPVQALRPDLIEKYGTENIYLLEFVEDDFMNKDDKVQFRIYPKGTEYSILEFDENEKLYNWFLEGKKPGFKDSDPTNPSILGHWTMSLRYLKSYENIPSEECPVIFKAMDGNMTPLDTVIGVLILKKK